MRQTGKASDQAALIWRALKWSELFSQWPDDSLRQLQPSARLVRYNRRTLVMSHDRHCRELLCVVSGCIEISCVNAMGDKYVNAIVGPGSTVPIVRLLRDIPLSYSYHAPLDSTILHLPADAVTAQLDARPELWKGIAELALHRQLASVQLLQQRQLANNRQRLASTLADLARIRGSDAKDGAFTITINQTELAAMLGVTRQTVNKELGWLTEQGIVDVAYGRIVVREMARLHALVH